MNVAVPNELTLRPTRVNRVTDYVVYSKAYAAFKIFWIVKENAADETVVAGRM